MYNPITCPNCGHDGPMMMLDIETYKCPICGTTFKA